MPNTRSYWKSGSTRSNSSNSRGSYRGAASRSGGMSSSGTASGAGYSPNQFKMQRTEITAKIGSFRNLNQQVTGAGKVTTFSPTTAQKWINFVNTGARVYKFNATQLARYCGSQWSNNPSASTAFRTLRSRFGAGIKAVARGRGNTWLVAATSKVNSGPFGAYAWN